MENGAHIAKIRSIEFTVTLLPLFATDGFFAS
jgi:hypothetical protein